MSTSPWGNPSSHHRQSGIADDIDYEIKNLSSQKQVVHLTENTSQMTNPGEQITLEKSLPLASLEPGIYQITIKVNDNVSKQVITPTAKFSVE